MTIDAKIEALKREVGCATLPERLPSSWALDKRGSTLHALRYCRGAGEVLILNHGGRG